MTRVPASYCTLKKEERGNRQGPLEKTSHSAHRGGGYLPRCIQDLGGGGGEIGVGRGRGYTPGTVQIHLVPCEGEHFREV